MRGFKHPVGVMLLFLLIPISVLITSCSSGELVPIYHAQMNQSVNCETNVTFDSEILDALETQSKVRAIIILKDNSRITIEGTKEERGNLLKQRDDWFEPRIDEILSSLFVEEFILIRRTSDGFFGEMSKNGLEKLVCDNRISAIYMDMPVYAAQSNESNKEG